MEGGELKSPTQTDDSQISSEISITLGETIEEFQECFEVISEELDEDEQFSKMTDESYDKKKCFLRKHLDELSRLHRLLADRHIHLIEEVSKNCPSLIHPPDSESTMSTNKCLSSAVKDDASKVKDTKTEESHLEVNEAEVIELQKQLADLKLVISESDLKFKTMEEEFETSKKKLLIANDLIQNLKGDPSSNLFQENQKLKHKLDLKQNQVNEAAECVTSRDREIHELEEQMDACVDAIRVRDAKIKKLKTKNDSNKSNIKRLEEILKSKEEIWNQDVAKLKVQLKNQTKSFDEMKKRLNFSMSERNRISVTLETLKEEKSSKDKKIRDLETRLNELQVEHEGVVSSFEDAEKILNELTLKLVDLEIEMESQKEVISVTTKEKIEAIRQLSFSVEHYMSKYKQLRQSSAANKTGCFDFLSGLNTQ